MRKTYKQPNTIIVTNLGPTVMFTTSGSTEGGVSEAPRGKENDFFGEPEVYPTSPNLWEE